ncbi:unnamed protein product [Heligmosomoides polygyrus]|uniref:Uncharacterized protein n=1 Tax=Heligmosomoides polygyrus TaxID=6339 RepID=A0A183FIT8_HELPZ|nr:unnamed protein product [Heligmosomoides polygyrus]
MASTRQTSVPLPINVYARAADVESGRAAPCVHSHVSGNSVECELPPARITPPSSQTGTAPSPHSRFIDELRRRTRLRSLNVPPHGHESLDSDLGFPPVCSPPPDEVTGAVPPEGCERFRRRTMSDATQSGFILNGGGAR